MTSYDQALARITQALRTPGTRALEELVPMLERDHPDAPGTWYASAELLARRGEFSAALQRSARAVSLMLDGGAGDGASLHIDRLVGECFTLPPAKLGPLLAYLMQFGTLMDNTGRIHALGPRLRAAAAPLIDPANQARFSELQAHAALGVLGFSPGCSEAWGTHVFDELVLPWIDAAAGAGQFDLALMLENVAYNVHVKRRESQEWFKATAGRWIPGLAAHARKARGRFMPVHAEWRPDPVRRVGLFIHNASMLAHVVVLRETLRAVRTLGARNYQFTLFVLGGRDAPMESAFRECGVAVRYLDAGTPAGIMARLQALARILREENFALLIWVTLVTAMAAAFALRIAPLQAWWAMKYHAADLPEIDARLAVEHVVTTKRMEGHDWLTIGNASSEWVDPAVAPAALELRARYPAEQVVAACIGREEKLDSPAFLEAVSTLLQRHPQMVFIWTGRVRRESIQGHFERAGVADRTVFAGWVNTKLYAQAMDLFLDSFPFPCGFSLKEAMAAGKPSVIFRSPESLETGITGAISPVVSGAAEVNPAVRERLRAIFTERADFDLYACADTPEQYVEIASRLVADAALRARAGNANRAFIEEFVASPEVEAVKFLDHLDTLWARVPVTGAAHAASA